MQKLTTETQETIKKSFLGLLYDKLDECHSDSYFEANRANQLAIEEFENNFENWNNSWIEIDSASYEQEKEFIIEFVKTL